MLINIIIPKNITINKIAIDYSSLFSLSCDLISISNTPVALSTKYHKNKIMMMHTFVDISQNIEKGKLNTHGSILLDQSKNPARVPMAIKKYAKLPKIIVCKFFFITKPPKYILKNNKQKLLKKNNIQNEINITFNFKKRYHNNKYKTTLI